MGAFATRGHCATWGHSTPIPGTSPEQPHKKIQTGCSGKCLLGGSRNMDRGDKDDSGLGFLISV